MNNDNTQKEEEKLKYKTTGTRFGLLARHSFPYHDSYPIDWLDL